MVLAQFGHDIEAVAVGQLEVEQHEREVGMLLDQGHGLAARPRLQHDGVALQLNKHAAQGLADQGVIVDDQKFHSGLPWCDGTRLQRIEAAERPQTRRHHLPQAGPLFRPGRQFKRTTSDAWNVTAPVPGLVLKVTQESRRSFSREPLARKW